MRIQNIIEGECILGLSNAEEQDVKLPISGCLKHPKLRTVLLGGAGRKPVFETFPILNDGLTGGMRFIITPSTKPPFVCISSPQSGDPTVFVITSGCYGRDERSTCGKRYEVDRRSYPEVYDRINETIITF